MNDNWNAFLAEQTLQPLSNLSEQDNLLCPLTEWGLISAQGADNKTFLQGQLSHDLDKLSPGSNRLAAFCNPKGRMLALMRLFERQQTVYMVLPYERIASIVKRLQMFVLRADVTLVDASAALVGLGISGPDASALLDQVGVYQSDDITILELPASLPDYMPRYMLWASATTMIGLWPRLSALAMPADTDSWRLRTIRAGEPSVYDATAEAFVPQMANLDQLDGIDFHKGCYVGQEIVARMHYLGQLKRRMYFVHAQSPECPAPGTAVYAPKQRGEQAVGQIVDAVIYPEHHIEALAVIVSECTQAQTLHLDRPDGPVLELGELPYALAADKTATR